MEDYTYPQKKEQTEPRFELRPLIEEELTLVAGGMMKRETADEPPVQSGGGPDNGGI